MTWQYRVMRRVCGKGTTKYYLYGIYEVYKSNDGHSWTQSSVVPLGETLTELRDNYGLMAEAFRLPVLDYETGKPIRPGKLTDAPHTGRNRAGEKGETK